MSQENPQENSPPDNGRTLRYMRELSAAKRTVEEANGIYRAILKRAKADGENTKELIATLKDVKLDPSVVRQNFKDRVRYLTLKRVLQPQPDLFDNLDTAVSEADQEFEDRWAATDAGYIAGRNGVPIDDNPYSPGSWFHVEWREQWFKGQAAIAAQMGPDEKPANTGRRRGKTKGVAVEAAADGADEDSGDGEKVVPIKRGRGRPRKNAELHTLN